MAKLQQHVIIDKLFFILYTVTINYLINALLIKKLILIIFQFRQN
jgi:hypothetical protein